ncbi:site-2 protease family protein [Amycolatopsis sp. H20-H5]|uniref:site-2 protease family protein n=1 Tax=Amycolatopsis sp. H20-H5 TaxID=3046309 RepID=UPI002DB8E017|nr:site-2 protease family protein [Amycolatopsis sp. H20-H5]MEC3982546.1 site-2 protease family protein [Amycolatopsis sp. H20-H5]
MQRSAVRPSPVFLGILAVAVVGGVLAAFGDQATLSARNQDPLIVAGVVLLVIGGWVASLSLHEFGHAMVAYRGGDFSVAHKGYLTMDVRKYTDPVFSIVLPLVFLLIGGIPLPGGAVWINRGALRSRSVSSWVSLAGPLSNLGVGIVIALVVSLIRMPDALVYGLSYLAFLQVLTFLINILPVPGLDGWGAIEPYLSPQARDFGARARPWAPLILFAVLFAFRPANALLQDIADTIFDAIGGYQAGAANGNYVFMFWRH